MDSDQAQKDLSISSYQQKIKPSNELHLKEFDFYLNDKDKEEIYSFFKFKLEDLIDPVLWSQIQHNEVVEDDKNSLEFLDEKHQDFQRFIQDKHFTFNIYDEIKVEVIFRPKKIYHSEKHISLSVTYLIEILNEDKFNFNGVLHIYTRAYCNNMREKLIQRKRTFYASSKQEKFQIDVIKKLFPDQGDEILWEIRFEQDNLLAQEEGLPVGLTNLGVTCYMNSYLQTMFHLMQFRKYVADLDNENKQDSFLFALQSLFYQMQEMKKAAASTHFLVKSFNWDLSQIFTQQDVQEFSFMFFEAIEQKSKQQGIEVDIIKELFEGKMESFIKCINIDYESKREEIFTDVQLVIKEQQNIYQALSNHFQSIKLEGDNAYATEGFGKQDAEKGLRFKTLPKVLTFQLNRFEYSYEFEQNTKINDRFEFYEEIDLEQFCQDKTQDYKYKLFGVNSHIGLQSESGHYKAFIKVNDQWMEFDDADVLKVNFEYVKQNSFGGRYNDMALDTRNFCLKLKKRLVYGHAYRLIYVQKSQYEQIVNNLGQKVQFSQNITEVNQPIIKQLEKFNFQKEHFNLVFTFKESFVNKETGLNGLFYKMYHLDDFRSHLDKENVLTLQLKKTINKRNFFAVIEKTFDLENNCSDCETQSESENLTETKLNRFYSLYIYNQKFGCLQLFDFEKFISNCDDESKFYFYLDVHNQQLDDEKLIVIKNFDIQNLSYTVEDIFSVDGESKMDSVLDRFELKEPYIFRKQFYQNKYEDIDENQQIHTNQASSEIVIILIRNAEISDWQIFVKFYNKMYFKILIDLYYDQIIEKYIYEMDITLKEQFKKIKQILEIPQEEKIIINYHKRNTNRSHSIKESSLTEEDESQQLAGFLYKNSYLEIKKESDLEQQQQGRFTIYIFGIQGIQLLSNNNYFDNVSNLNEFQIKLQENQDYQKYYQLLQNQSQEIGLQIRDFSILTIKQNGCWQAPEQFHMDSSYDLIIIPNFQYIDENSNYKLILQFKEDGRYIRQYPKIYIQVPNFTIEKLIIFLQEFFTLYQPYGQKENTSTYKIRDNIQSFEYVNSKNELLNLGTTTEKDIKEMTDKDSQIILGVNFKYIQQKQKNGLKINVQLYQICIIYQNQFFRIIQNIKKIIIK